MATVHVRFGSKTFDLKISLDSQAPSGPTGQSNAENGGDIKDPSTSDVNQTGSEDISEIRTFGQFRQLIAQEAGVCAEQMKILFNGRKLEAADDTPLAKLSLKNGSTVMLLAPAAQTFDQDPGYLRLAKYEKEHLIGLQEMHKKIGEDLAGLCKNYLDGAMREDAIKKMEKRLAYFAEHSLRHLEAIDGLEIVTEQMSDEQKKRNREKRKQLVGGIQSLLNANDKHTRELGEYRHYIEHPEVQTTLKK